MLRSGKGLLDWWQILRAEQVLTVTRNCYRIEIRVHYVRLGNIRLPKIIVSAAATPLVAVATTMVPSLK